MKITKVTLKLSDAGVAGISKIRSRLADNNVKIGDQLITQDTDLGDIVKVAIGALDAATFEAFENDGNADTTVKELFPQWWN